MAKLTFLEALRLSLNATKKYIDDKTAGGEPVEDYDLVNKKYVDDITNELKEEIANAKDTLFLNDQVTGDVYLLQIRNGALVTSMAPNNMEMLEYPNKVSYAIGDRFNTDGMTLSLISKDNSSITVDDLENVTFIPEYMEEGTTEVTVSYSYYGINLTKTISVTVSEFDPAVVLIDFNYTDNGDGTYTITGWKGTKNGEPSTEIIIPDNNKIKL